MVNNKIIYKIDVDAIKYEEQINLYIDDLIYNEPQLFYQVKKNQTFELNYQIKNTITEEIEYFSKDNSANAVYYIYIADSKDKNSIVKEKERLEEFIETKIDLTADYAYLLSEYPYSIDHSNKILGILDERFGIKAQGLKMVEIDQIKKDKIKSEKE